MNNIVGHVLLTTTDKNLGARDCITAVCLWLGFGAQQGKVGAGMWFRQAHGAGPFAGDHFRKIRIFKLVAAMHVQREHSTVRQAGIHTERQIGAHHHFLKWRRHRYRKALTAKLFTAGHRGPAVFTELLIRLWETLRCFYFTIFKVNPFFVTATVQRCQYTFIKLCAFFQNGIDNFCRQIVTTEAGKM